MYTLYVCTFPRCSMNAICIFTDMIIGPPKWSHERIPTSRHPKTRLAKAYAEAARVRSEDFFCTGGGGVWVVWNIIPEIWVSNIPNNSHIFQAGVTFFNPSFWVSMIFSTVKHHDFQEMIRYSFTETNILVAPEHRPSKKETIVFQPSIFGCYVSFSEGNVCGHVKRRKRWIHVYIYIYTYMIFKRVEHVWPFAIPSWRPHCVIRWCSLWTNQPMKFHFLCVFTTGVFNPISAVFVIKEAFIGGKPTETRNKLVDLDMPFETTCNNLDSDYEIRLAILATWIEVPRTLGVESHSGIVSSWRTTRIVIFLGALRKTLTIENPRL